MALTSSSTLSEVQAQYEDNASYDLNASVAECKLFIQAARILIRRTIDESAHGSTRMRESVSRLENELKKAEAWLAANGGGADGTLSASRDNVRYFSLENFR